MSIATRFVASWGNRRSPAMSYNGNDYLSNATADFRSADSQGAIEVWFRTSTANAGALVSSADEAANNNYLVIDIAGGNIRTYSQAGGSQNQVAPTVSPAVSDGKWHALVVSSSGTAWTIIVDGTTRALSVVAGSNTGDWFADVPTRDHIMVAAYKILSGLGGYFTGEISCIRIYSRPMLQPEAAANFVRGRNAPALNGVGLVFDLPMSEGTGEPTDRVGVLILPRTGATWTIATARN